MMIGDLLHFLSAAQAFPLHTMSVACSARKGGRTAVFRVVQMMEVDSVWEAIHPIPIILGKFAACGVLDRMISWWTLIWGGCISSPVLFLFSEGVEAQPRFRWKSASCFIRQQSGSFFHPVFFLYALWSPY